MSITKLCNKIEYAPVRFLFSVVGGVANFKNGYSFLTIPKVINASFKEESKDSNAGLLVIQKLDLTATLEKDVVNALSLESNIFRLTFSDGNMQVWGTIDLPVNIDNSKRENKGTSILFSRQNDCFEF